MRYSRRALLLATTFFLFFGLQILRAQQNQETANIVGQLRVARASFPNERILISIETRGMPFGSMYSDNEGRYEFDNLPGNSYSLSIREEGYEPVNVTVIVNPILTKTNVVNITLTPRTAERPSETAKRTSGANPYAISTVDYTVGISKKAVKEFESGNQAQSKGRTDEAIGRFEKALAIEPKFYQARNNLGSAYLSKGKIADAEMQFRRVAAENQGDASAFFNLGNLYLLTKKFDKAEPALLQGLSKEPNSALGHFVLGSLYEQEGKSAEAEQELRKVLNLDVTYAKAHLQLVNLYLAERKTDAARRELQAFINSFPEDPLTPKAREVLKRLEASR